MPHILVVDDEITIRELLKFNLEKEGYKVTSAADGEEALNVMNNTKFDLVLLDVMLPGINGLEVCRKMRSDRSLASVPVIMLTAKGEEIDKVLGLELGADDYLTKPFGVRELLARIKVRLRRTSPENEEQKIVRGDLSIELSSFTVQVRNETIDFTPKEFELLRLLASHPGKVYSRDELLEKIWGYEYPGDTRTVDVHIPHLRQKGRKTRQILNILKHSGESGIASKGNHNEYSNKINLSCRDFIRFSFVILSLIQKYEPKGVRFGYELLVPVLILSGMVMYVYTDKLLSRIERMVSKIDMIMKGKYQFDVLPIHKDEIGKLEEELDKLAHHNAGLIRREKKDAHTIQKILSGMKEGVIILDHLGNIILINSAVEEMFGRSQRTIEGKPLMSLMRNKELDEFVAETLGEKKEGNIEFKAKESIYSVWVSILTDENTFWVSCWSFVILQS